MSSLTIPRNLLDTMLEHCRSAYPDEACGIVAGKSRVGEKIYLMTNIEKSPVSYLMDPADQFRAMKEMRNDGNTMVAIFHSHPVSPAYPSARDVSLASYPDSVYIIVSLIDQDRPDIKAFEIVEGAVKEVMLTR